MLKHWTPEEDAILYANEEKSASYLMTILPDRSASEINQRKAILGISRNVVWRNENLYNRPLTEESAYHIRKDYAAKIKLGYTHEKAVDWLEKANQRHREIIEDVLTNPKYDAEVAICERRSKYTL